MLPTLMENDQNDAIDELVKTEQLQVFDVIDEYCDICSDITPHHIEKAPNKNVSSLEYEPETVFSAPISTKECVRCRENEENKLDLYIQ